MKYVTSPQPFRKNRHVTRGNLPLQHVPASAARNIIMQHVSRVCRPQSSVMLWYNNDNYNDNDNKNIYYCANSIHQLIRVSVCTCIRVICCLTARINRSSILLKEMSLFQRTTEVLFLVRCRTLYYNVRDIWFTV